MHGRTLLFILVAFLVGTGLLYIAPDLSASGTATAGNQDAGDAEGTLGQMPVMGDLAEVALPSVETDSVVSGFISPVFTREVQHWAPKIAEWSALYGLDPDIIATIMQIESCGDPAAVSYAGAQGLFQVMPFHFAPGEMMQDPDTNARRGIAFYIRQLEYTGQDVYLSFAGYNGGYAASGSSYDHWASETQRYYTWARGIYDDARSGLAQSPTLEQWLAAGGQSGCQRAANRLGI